MEAGPLPHADSRLFFGFGMRRKEKPWLLRIWHGDMTHPVGAGLANIHNTCFLNAVLQCVTHTVPLVEKLWASDHYSTCSAGPGEFCALCALRDHIDICVDLSGYVVRPIRFAINLSKISADFELGCQEDAHEFLQCLLNRVHNCCISPVCGNQPPPVGDDADSLIQQVFGSRARSQLRCSDCGHVSDTFEPLLDLSLGIDGMASLTEALESYTKIEMLEPSECDGCHAKVPKEKQLKLDQAPQVALFHLKRFKMDGAGVCKINNFVEFPLELDLQPFLSSPQDEEQLNYDLYAVVVHLGNLDRGHYFSIIRSSPSSWHLMNDAYVDRCSTKEVLDAQAYMLFYIKQGSSPWFSSFMESRMANQTSGAPGFMMDWREKKFALGESSSSCSSMHSPETRKDQSAGTDDTPESVLCEVEGDSCSPASLGPCNQGVISDGAEQKAPLDGVMKQSTGRIGSEECIVCDGVSNDETSTSLTEDDQEGHQSPENHVSSKDDESTAKEATKDRAGNDMLSSIPSLQRSSFQSCVTPNWSHTPRPLMLRNPIPMKRQRKALSDLDNIPSPSPVAPEEKSTCNQSLSLAPSS